MAVKRRKAKRRATLDEHEEEWLRGGDGGFVQFKQDEELAALWAANRDWIIAEHVAEWPGTRPTRWWHFDAPEPLGETEDETDYLKRHGLLFGGELE